MMILSWWRRRGAERDARAAARLTQLRHQAAVSGADVVFVRRVYQNARRGTKAVVVRDGTNAERDAWFWWARVAPGELLAVTASSGWGPHTRREDVLYVGNQGGGTGIIDRLDARTLNAAGRHLARTAAS